MKLMSVDSALKDRLDSFPADVLAVKHDTCSFADQGKSKSHSLMVGKERENSPSAP